MKSLQRVFSVLVLVTALFAFATAVIRPPPEHEMRDGSITIVNQLTVTLSVQCDSGHKQQKAVLPPGGADGFEFIIIEQDYWRCVMSAPGSPTSRNLWGDFVLWARSPSFNPGDYGYWLINADGAWKVPNVNRGITPSDGQLIYHWQ